jgi:transposase IS66-like protein/transposase
MPTALIHAAVRFDSRRWIFHADIDRMTNGSGARRRWSLEEKLRIVAESERGPRQVSATARRHGLLPSQLIQTAKLNDVDPQAWLTDVPRRLNDHPASWLAELLPWNWLAPRSSSNTRPESATADVDRIH